MLEIKNASNFVGGSNIHVQWKLINKAIVYVFVFKFKAHNDFFMKENIHIEKLIIIVLEKSPCKFQGILCDVCVLILLLNV